MQPTQDRYREIQQALAEKGYLKSEPTGVWGADSVDALKQFQAEQSIPTTGKLNSRSIIGLGLGPKTAAPLVVPPPEPSSTRPQ
jgi:peptidoglycan hydrolase-like protein with peptidoglycan-binding domain